MRSIIQQSKIDSSKYGIFLMRPGLYDDKRVSTVFMFNYWKQKIKFSNTYFSLNTQKNNFYKIFLFDCKLVFGSFF